MNIIVEIECFNTNVSYNCFNYYNNKQKCYINFVLLIFLNDITNIFLLKFLINTLYNVRLSFVCLILLTKWLAINTLLLQNIYI